MPELSREEAERLEREMRLERRRDFRDAMAEFFESERGIQVLDMALSKLADKQMARVGRWTLAGVFTAVGAIALYVAWVLEHGGKP